jgi:hypothetical protein
MRISLPEPEMLPKYWQAPSISCLQRKSMRLPFSLLAIFLYINR